MKFEDLKFHSKEKVKASVIKEISDILEHNLDFESLSQLSILRYIDILVDDQDYNPKSGVFYDKLTNRKLSYTFLAGIAHDYILDHIEEFKL